jgi:hypothetical protein
MRLRVARDIDPASAPRNMLPKLHLHASGIRAIEDSIELFNVAAFGRAGCCFRRATIYELDFRARAAKGTGNKLHRTS